MTPRQMSDAELDAILGSLNDEITEGVDKATDVEAGREQLLRRADSDDLPSHPCQLAPSADKELTTGEPTWWYSAAAHLGAPDVSVAPSSMSEVWLLLHSLEGRIHRHSAVERRPSGQRMWDGLVVCRWPVHVESLLGRFRDGLAQHTLDREDALHIIDQLDHELQPKACYPPTGPRVLPGDASEFRRLLDRLRCNVSNLYDDGDNLVTV